MFWMHKLWIGPIHLSIVRNVPMFMFNKSSFGWFFTWDKGWACGTLRIRSVCLNLDIDVRK